MLIHCALLLSQYVVLRVLTNDTVTDTVTDTDIDTHTDTADADTEAVCELYFVNHMSYR